MIAYTPPVVTLTRAVSCAAGHPRPNSSPSRSSKGQGPSQLRLTIRTPSSGAVSSKLMCRPVAVKMPSTRCPTTICVAVGGLGVGNGPCGEEMAGDEGLAGDAGPPPQAAIQLSRQANAARRDLLAALITSIPHITPHNANADIQPNGYDAFHRPTNNVPAQPFSAMRTSGRSRGEAHTSAHNDSVRYDHGFGFSDSLLE